MADWVDYCVATGAAVAENTTGLTAYYFSHPVSNETLSTVNALIEGLSDTLN